MLSLPNLVAIVVAPGEQIIIQTRDKDGNIIVPQYPDPRLQESNPDQYAQELEIYEDYKAKLQDMVNQIEYDRMHKGITVHTDQIEEKITESSRSLNPQMLEAIIHILNTEIAFALGFPLSLLDARGVELTTARNILTTMNIVLRGIQRQYQQIALDLIYEQFPGAVENAGISFVLRELDPHEAREIAQVEKLYADVLKIFKEIGASDDDLRALSRKYNILPECELGGAGLIKGLATAENYDLDSSDYEAAFDVVKQIAADRKQLALSAENLLEVIEEENVG